MLQTLPSFIVGVIALMLYTINSILFAGATVIVGLIRFFIPCYWLKHKIDVFIHLVLINGWIYVNKFIIWLTIDTKFEVHGKGKLSRKGQYFLISNHQAWTDVLVLEQVFGGKIPTLMFFMKRELIWMLPVLGFACWVSGFPFVARYSASYLKKHPDKKGHDLEITQKSCERFDQHPVTIVNFLEGTRFTKLKHEQQSSPYDYLLKPKVTGFAFVLAAMGESLQDILNVTIIYPEGRHSLWDFVCGRIRKIIVHYEVIKIASELRGVYDNRNYRAALQKWLSPKWQNKDVLIKEHIDSE